jgi:hypothetical protein
MTEILQDVYEFHYGLFGYHARTPRLLVELCYWMMVLQGLRFVCWLIKSIIGDILRITKAPLLLINYFPPAQRRQLTKLRCIQWMRIGARCWNRLSYHVYMNHWKAASNISNRITRLHVNKWWIRQLTLFYWKS